MRYACNIWYKMVNVQKYEQLLEFLIFFLNTYTLFNIKTNRYKIKLITIKMINNAID